MQVIIPLAGKGTRLRPHTHLVPKPMLKVAGRASNRYRIGDSELIHGDRAMRITRAALRAAGCDHPFLGVEEGVSRYLKQLGPS